MYKKLQRSFKATIVTGDVSKKKVISEMERIYVQTKIEAMVRFMTNRFLQFGYISDTIWSFWDMYLQRYTLFTEMKAGRLRFFCTGKHVKTHLVERVNKRDFLYICIWEFFVFSRGKRGNKKFATMSRNCWSVGMSEMTLMLWPSLVVFWRLDCNLSADEKEYNFKVIKRRGEDTFS